MGNELQKLCEGLTPDQCAALEKSSLYSYLFLIGLFVVVAVELWNRRERLRRSPKLAFVSGALLIGVFSAIPAFVPNTWQLAVDFMFAAFNGLGVSLVVLGLSSRPNPDLATIADLQARVDALRTRAARMEEQIASHQLLPEGDPAKPHLIASTEIELLRLEDRIDGLEDRIAKERMVQ
jgi:hypothetical protein